MSGAARTAVIHIETAQNFNPKRSPESRLAEAVELARAIELEIVIEDHLKLRKIEAGHLISGGHLERLIDWVKHEEVELVFVNHHLSPIQQRNLEKKFNAKVIDRTGLILEIFGARAQTREGVLQVQHAHLKYQKSRLVRSWTHLERQRGGRGFLGGPGETQIEADRRAIDEQITAIEKRIEKIRKTRSLQREGRKRNDTPIVALVGYTNAGKSTFFNRVSNADVLAKDMLFATLDPTMRRVNLPMGTEIVLSDTVGFISDLPTELVAAFRATLEEVIHADVIIHVRDISNPEQREQAKDVYEVLEALGLDPASKSVKLIELYNKIDRVDDAVEILGEPVEHGISALNGQGIDKFLAFLEELLRDQVQSETIVLAFQYGSARAWLFENGLVKNEDIIAEGYRLDIEWSEAYKNRFATLFGPIY